jgi:hypothetical protein
MTRTGRAPRSLSLAVIDKRGEAPTYLLCIQFIVGISEGRKEDSCALAAAVSVGVRSSWRELSAGDGHPELYRDAQVRRMMQGESACKPASVSREDPGVAAIHLGSALPPASCGPPGDSAGPASAAAQPTPCTSSLVRACSPPAWRVTCREGPQPTLMNDVIGCQRRFVQRRRLGLDRLDRDS